MPFKSTIFFARCRPLIAAAAGAHPNIYTYLDANGIRHYTDVPDNNRYKLLSLSPQDMTKAAILRFALLARATQYDAIIEKAAVSSAVEANLLRAVIVVESGFNSRAVSKRGAVGLMQLMPATATRFGVSNPYDPKQNVRAGARISNFSWTGLARCSPRACRLQCRRRSGRSQWRPDSAVLGDDGLCTAGAQGLSHAHEQPRTTSGNAGRDRFAAVGYSIS